MLCCNALDERHCWFVAPMGFFVPVVVMGKFNVRIFFPVYRSAIKISRELDCER